MLAAALAPGDNILWIASVRVSKDQTGLLLCLNAGNSVAVFSEGAFQPG